MSRQDIARAMNEAVAASEGLASGHGPRLAQQLLPPVQVHIIECAAVSALPVAIAIALAWLTHKPYHRPLC